MFGRAIKKS